jgi:hypothetical protein
MITLTLVIEKTKTGFLGRVIFKDNLIIAEASNLTVLEAKLSKLLTKHHQIELSKICFKHTYDLSSLFEAFGFLKISTVAKIAGVNASLLRQYAVGNKHASQTQAKKIEDTIHRIGKQLIDVQVYGRGEEGDAII